MPCICHTIHSPHKHSVYCENDGTWSVNCENCTRIKTLHGPDYICNECSRLEISGNEPLSPTDSEDESD